MVEHLEKIDAQDGGNQDEDPEGEDHHESEHQDVGQQHHLHEKV